MGRRSVCEVEVVMGMGFRGIRMFSTGKRLAIVIIMPNSPNFASKTNLNFDWPKIFFILFPYISFQVSKGEEGTGLLFIFGD